MHTAGWLMPDIPPVERADIDRKVYGRAKMVAKKLGVTADLLGRLATAGKLDAVWHPGKTGLPVWFVNRGQLERLILDGRA